MSERRTYFRHPVSAPIQVFPQQAEAVHLPMRDISSGGLAFRSNVLLDKGNVLKIRIPHVDPPFEAACVVCWHRRLDHDAQFEIGVMFLDEQTRFRLRMVEQICHIIDYHQHASDSGRKLSFEEAAQEWIEAHAADFGD